MRFFNMTIVFMELLVFLLASCTTNNCTINNIEYCSLEETKVLLEEVIDQDIQLVTYEYFY